MLLESKKRPIAGDDVGCTPLDGRGDVFVVVRVVADAGKLPRTGNQVRQDDDVLEPQFRVSAAEHFAYLGVGERTQHFVDDGRREHDFEALVAQKPFDQLARCAAWMDDGADVDVRVENRTDQWLLGPAPRLAGLLSRRALRLERDLERLFLAHAALLLLL